MCYNLIKKWIKERLKVLKEEEVKKEVPLEIRCKRCHRILKNEDAKLIGYGNTCYKKHLKEIERKRFKKLF